MDKEYEEITIFLKENIPMIYDMEKNDLVYDERSMFFKACKYIYKLKEENKKLRGKKW